MNLYPLQFEPLYKEKIWGGNKIKNYFNKNTATEKTGESWEIAAHHNGNSIVSQGKLAGKTLSEIYSNFKTKLMGNLIKVKNYEKFPLLLKILDASDKLSVQVHPPNDYALKIEAEPGKTEMWYIIEAKPEAQLVFGLKEGTSRKTMKKAIKNGTLEKHLNRVQVTAGDVFFIPSGTIHALEEGILLAEIQQNSDTTYRVYDWNRKGKDGNPRELHIEKALEVTNFTNKNTNLNYQLTCKEDSYQQIILAACPHFVTEKIICKQSYNISPNQQRFYTLMFLEGKGNLNWNGQQYHIKKGDSFLLPACLNKVQINGKLTFLKSYLPDSKQYVLNKLKNKGFSNNEIKKLPGIKKWETEKLF